MDPFYAKVNEQLYSMEPSAEAAYSLGRLFLKKEKYEKKLHIRYMCVITRSMFNI